jgi:NAD(P)-dependent dehydrogenase (short-subunit alcohol dehydrogenase family)
MELRDRVAVVTGGASGIGRALSRRFATEGASVVVADLDEAGAKAVAGEIGGIGVGTNVGVEAEVQALVKATEDAHGRIDVFCSNAGIGGGGSVDAPDELWQQIWDVNLMAHVYAARAVLPAMLDRGDGYLLNTASAAGLLTNLGNAPYSVTKHGAVALAEWLSITYGDKGIKVSCLCPQGVRTNMLMGALDDLAGSAVAAQGIIEPEAVADAVVDAMREERFLVLPHPEVLTYFQRKAGDYDRWIAGMRRLQAKTESDL